MSLRSALENNVMNNAVFQVGHYNERRDGTLLGLKWFTDVIAVAAGTQFLYPGLPRLCFYQDEKHKCPEFNRHLVTCCYIWCECLFVSYSLTVCCTFLALGNSTFGNCVASYPSYLCCVRGMGEPSD